MTKWEGYLQKPAATCLPFNYKPAPGTPYCICQEWFNMSCTDLFVRTKNTQPKYNEKTKEM